ncbi:MAG: hypothetical protein Unbinned4509contig1000_14 [Prokaryotic dsDNA virus sp.]|nr:MAG: hypothetical protein Unbinned4509contig1000_14 [Prokaryotic dsDNA virus sp.]|tara:strand:- start:5462 stop:6835 length:1374 start_codon:yes stop_codon:yes gene_type:complete
METVVIDTVTSSEVDTQGEKITEVITTTTSTTTISNEDSGDILDGDNGFVSSSKEGDMDSDWGGQGPASMPSGSTCGELGPDKCAMITGSGNSTSTMGVSGMGTTFIQTVNLSSLSNMPGYGGKANYTIKVLKEDASDRIYMHLTGYDGSTAKFSGTDILSESGVNSGYSSYSGGFDFGGKLTSITVEIGGRDINLAVGPMFDDVTVNVLYNLINTIVTEHIQTIETFIALDLGFDDSLVEDFFDNNTVTEDTSGDIIITPVDEPDTEVTVASVEAEINLELELDLAPVVEIDLPTVDVPDVEISEVEIVAEVEASIEAELEEVVEVAPEPEPETVEVKTVEVETVEAEAEPEVKVVVKAKPTKKQIKTAAKKVVAKIKPKARYSVEGQTKTLIVMNILADNKTFFNEGRAFTETQGFFSGAALTSEDNVDNFLANLQFIGFNNAQMGAMIDSQYRR